jgi:predicted aspartyl protease
MKVTCFAPEKDLIVVKGSVQGPLHPRGRPLRLVVDTGAAETIIVPDLVDEIGYNPRQGEAITTMRSAVGQEPGCLLRVARFHALGHQSRDFRIHVQDLPEGWGIEGLIGLSFLRQFNYEVRSQEGRIRVERVRA